MDRPLRTTLCCWSDHSSFHFASTSSPACRPPAAEAVLLLPRLITGLRLPRPQTPSMTRVITTADHLRQPTTPNSVLPPLPDDAVAPYRCTTPPTPPPCSVTTVVVPLDRSSPRAGRAGWRRVHTLCAWRVFNASFITRLQPMIASQLGCASSGRPGSPVG
jgi:hypothetical protein